jgi:4'-phosphopantetheinyl transferase
VKHNSLLHVRCVITIGRTESQVAADFDILDREERATFQRFVFARDRLDYAAAHALLRRTLSEAKPGVEPGAWRFARTAAGKPYVVSPPADSMHFSISHTRGLVACATGCQGPVGIDVECDPLAPDNASLLADVCSRDEQAQIITAMPFERDKVFLDLWTLKEAYLKARGVGIGVDLTRYWFDLRKPGSISAPFMGQAARIWWLALIRPTATSRAALAVRCETPPVLDAAVIDATASRILRPVRSSHGDQEPGGGSAGIVQ